MTKTKKTYQHHGYGKALNDLMATVSDTSFIIGVIQDYFKKYATEKGILEDITWKDNYSDMNTTISHDLDVLKRSVERLKEKHNLILKEVYIDK